jgi:putative cell wall-binding protein
MVIAMVATFVPVVPAGAIPSVPETIYVDAVNGDDATGDGSVGSPFMSIKRALGFAEYDDTIDIAAGTYSASTTGETFPLPITESKLTLRGVEASSCVIDAEWIGSIIWMMDGTELDLSGLTLTHGFGREGGALMAGYAKANLVDCVLTENFAGLGGAVFSYESTVTLSGCDVIGNGEASVPLFPAGLLPQGDYPECLEGGAIYSVASVLDIYGSSIGQNSAVEAGGGILAATSTMNVEETDFYGNSTSANNVIPMAESGLFSAGLVPAQTPIHGLGGALLTVGAEVGIRDCGFWENSALMGSSLMGMDSSVTVEASQFDSDTALVGTVAVVNGLSNSVSASYGELVPTVLKEAPRVTIEGSAFRGNMGAPIAAQGVVGLMRNCLIAGNTVDLDSPADAATALLIDSDFDIVNTTFADNVSDGPAILVTSYINPQATQVQPLPEVRVTNSIVWDESISGVPVVGATVSYSDLRYTDELLPTTIDASVISTDPLFADAGSGDYSLAFGSPCIDTGLEFELAPLMDIVGNDRPVDGDNSGTAEWDMGAYEYFDTATDGRLAGEDRYETAVEISQDHFAAADTAVLATGRFFADGLSASGLAGAYRAPMLLTDPNTLPTLVADELVRLGVSRVIICGDEQAISAGVADAVAALGEIEVQRIGGRDRYETAALLSSEIGVVTGSDPALVFVARGDTFPDALAVSPIAWSAAAPVLLVRPEELPRYTVDYFIETIANTKTRTVIVGGEAAVSSDVKGGLVALGVPAEDRIAGADRYETACAVATWAYDEGLADFGVVGVATGEDFADALAGGPGIGASGGVVLLNPKSTANPMVCEMITAHAVGISALQIFGSGAAITDEVAAALNDCRTP